MTPARQSADIQRFQVLLPDLAATQRFGAAIAEAIEDRAVIAMIGQMGAGKTTLVKAVAAALGVEEVVQSPTFTMMNEYHSGRLPLYHLDLYRLSEQNVPAPLDHLLAEIEEFIDTPMVAMIEWAELFPQNDSESGSALPLDHLTIHLSYINDGDSDSRVAVVQAYEAQSEELAARIAQSTGVSAA